MGVDVGGKRKAFDVALVEEQRLVGLRGRQTVDDVVGTDKPASAGPDEPAPTSAATIVGRLLDSSLEDDPVLQRIVRLASTVMETPHAAVHLLGQVVEDAHAVTRGEQAVGEMRADEARTSGDQDVLRQSRAVRDRRPREARRPCPCAPT